MSRVQTIEALGILGGVGSVLSPVSILYWFTYYFRIFLNPIVLRLLLATFLIALIGGFVGCGLGIRASTYLKVLPDRARRELKIAGILVIVVSFICYLNIWVFLSGFILLLAGIEADTFWRKIQQAREETGFPLITVNTAMGSSWHRRLSCRYCGAPLVTLSAFARGPSVQVRSICPLDKTEEVTRLPLAYLEEWVPVLADRLHRCEVCGERTTIQIPTSQSGFSTRLRAYCSSNHRNHHFRHIWTPLYPHIARSPPEDISFRSRQVYPRFVSPIQDMNTQPVGLGRMRVQTQVTSLPTSSPQSIRIRARPIRTAIKETPRYCFMCGVRISVGDQFCYRCGSRI